MSEQATLFELPAPLFEIEPQPLGPKDTRSYTRRLTIRNRALLAGGVHPATKMPLLPTDRMPYDGARCGNCKHLTSHSHDRTWYKCSLVPITGGPGTDIRLKWPACIKWERE
jgi:hypothetical protein